MKGDWIRVTKGTPCPICNKPNWCLVTRDGTAALCKRVESTNERPEAGWFHWTGAPSNGKVAPRPKLECEHCINFEVLSESYRRASNGKVADAANELGVSAESLVRLHCGWDGEAVAAPMHDAARHVIGIRRRFPDGTKKSVRGGHEGVFLPWPSSDGPVFVVEGFSDCAALLTLGLNAIGRPSCSGGTKIVAAIVALRDVVIVADNDTPGLRGAAALARILTPLCKSVDLREPPDGAKDCREALLRGATRKDFE